MFNILNIILGKNSKNHVSMVLVLLTLLMIFPSSAVAKMTDYSKFDWDSYYESHKYMFGDTCSAEDENEDGSCKEDTLLKGQKRFFVRTYKILAKYQQKGLIISDDLILTTALYGLAGEHTGNEEGNQDYKNTMYNKKEGELKAGLLYDEEIDDDEFDIEEKYDSDEALKLSEEKDTIITLLKNSIAYYTYCYGVYGDPEVTVKEDGTKIYTCPDGGTVTKLYDHSGLVKKTYSKCATNLSASTGAAGYELGYWTFYSSKMNHDSILSTPLNIFGIDMKDEKYDECKEASSQYTEGTVYQYTDQEEKIGKHISNNKYFDFLKETAYFDKKPHLQSEFYDVLEKAGVKCLTINICDDSLEAKGNYDEYKDMLEADRLRIIHDIIDTLNQNGIPMQYEGYGVQEYDDASYTTNDRASFYWPIGGDTIESRQVSLSSNSNSSNTVAKRLSLGYASIKNAFNKGLDYRMFDEASSNVTLLFADGTPKYTTDNVTSYFGERTSPITGNKEMHYGIDIGAEEGTNIIAAYDGTVTSKKDGCTSGDYECNEGYGNYVIVSHKNGDYTVYAHLASIEDQIKEGTTVLRGELIGKSGSTGATKTPNFYYELRMGGNSVSSAVDPIANTSAGRNTPPKDEDLRPIGYQSSGVGARSTRFDGTHLTMSEFAGRVRAYCSGHTGIAAEMCEDPEKVYSASQTNNVNPELVITRAMAEGNSPGKVKNNYWGMGCTNTGGYAACITYSSLEDGIRGFAGMVTKYNNLMEMQMKYAYIGANWYNPGSWSVGGCKYFPYIKGYMSPQRQDEVTAICSKTTECTTSGGDCTPTIQEDQNAYATWQVEQKLGPYMHNVFGT